MNSNDESLLCRLFLFDNHIRGGKDLEMFIRSAKMLAREGVLTSSRPDVYQYAEQQHEEYEGIYKGYRKSYVFVIMPDDEDIYVAEQNKGTAMHNDKVRVRVVPSNYTKHKREGVIVDVIERANETVVGTYDRQQHFGFVIPDDERIGTDIFVDLKNTLDARSGAKVLVKITKWPEGDKKPEGIITEILGYKGDVGLDINCIMANHKIPFNFPDDVIKTSQKIDTVIHEDSDRWDLRDVQMVTIDGEDAKDLDDAVSGRKLPNGNYELGVHIADVSHYVTSGQAIDNEAYKRGTSVYLVDRVVPMLPEVLSNGICSLNAHEDRYAMTCMMEINKDGKVVHYRIRPSIIHVGRRCSYKEVYKALEENIIPDDLQDFMPMLRDLAEISKILNAMRRRRGALDFDFPEYKVLLDHDGTPLRIVKRDRTMAERLIEECMLIANETVATHLEHTHRTSVYRIHENPSEEKLDLFQKVLNYLGQNLVLSTDGVTPRDFQKILDVVKGQDIEQVAQIMTLRSMQQAKYSTNNVGHFGLASTCYTHFTSPIRRYPDLMVHRLLKADMHWKNGYSKRDVDEAFLAGAVEHSSIQEQVATEAERDTVDLKKTQYMVPFVGEVFEGTISSITSFGMFVELENGIDGLVHMSMMNDDYYFFDEEHFVLVGKRTGKTYHLGEKVTVTLVKADVEKKQIDFVLGGVNNLMAIQEQLQNGSDYASSRDGYGSRKGRKSSGKSSKKSSRRDSNKSSHSKYDAFSKKTSKGKSSRKKSNKTTKRSQSKKSKSKRKR
ncbi:MAG: ribonuclease R [Veillonella sp.]|nr:ribonuclease R [Veillonella sp.]